ncbi:uncharacterized protein LOC143294964 isoform X2 [Babylonia areolata]|uniref:uncharacterized protein LOC143294964 isoform X2 n=1 Tax=Babylonia areolata TaxID=304850 RepID=UPI003FD59C3F
MDPVFPVTKGPQLRWQPWSPSSPSSSSSLPSPTSSLSSSSPSSSSSRRHGRDNNDSYCFSNNNNNTNGWRWRWRQRWPARNPMTAKLAAEPKNKNLAAEVAPRYYDYDYDDIVSDDDSDAYALRAGKARQSEYDRSWSRFDCDDDASLQRSVCCGKSYLWDCGEPMSLIPASDSRPPRGSNNNNNNNKDNKLKDNKDNFSSSSTGQDKENIHFANLQRILLRFADRTSMQGVPYIRTSESAKARLAWVLLSLMCLLLLGGHLYYLSAVYYSFPKHSTLELGFSPLAFPALTFCNVNPVRRSRLQHVPEELRRLVTLTEPNSIVEKMAAAEYDTAKKKRRKRAADGRADDDGRRRRQGSQPNNRDSRKGNNRARNNNNNNNNNNKGNNRYRNNNNNNNNNNADNNIAITSNGSSSVTTASSNTSAAENSRQQRKYKPGHGSRLYKHIKSVQRPHRKGSKPKDTDHHHTTISLASPPTAPAMTTGPMMTTVTTPSAEQDTGQSLQQPGVSATIEPNTGSSNTTTASPGFLTKNDSTRRPENSNGTRDSLSLYDTILRHKHHNKNKKKHDDDHDNDNNEKKNSKGTDRDNKKDKKKNDDKKNNNNKDKNNNNHEPKPKPKPDTGYKHSNSENEEEKQGTKKEIEFINDLDLGIEFKNTEKRRELEKEEEERNEGRRSKKRRRKKEEAFSEPSVSASIQEEFLFLYSNISQEQRQLAGHQAEDMIVDCSFSGRRCHPQNFTVLSSTLFGNCFTIDHPAMVTTRGGYQGGLSLVVFVESEEYLRGMVTGTGLQVIIHAHNTLPFPEEDGIAVMAGTETNVALRRLNINRLGKPHGDCQEGSVFQQKYGHAYTRRACQAFCEQGTIMDRCQCYSQKDGQQARHVLKRPLLAPCRTDHEIRCMLDVQYDYEEGLLHCGCENPCTEQSYYKTVSMRHWPADEYTKVLVETLCRRKNNTECSKYRQADPRTIAQSFVKINIFYEDLNYENITEVKDYEPSQFASDVGGTVGLWLGLSFLSAFEVLQFLGEIFVYLFSFGPCRKQSKKPEEPERELRLSSAGNERHCDVSVTEFSGY